jgi:membrane protease YdiL (CAAX protease family)
MDAARQSNPAKAITGYAIAVVVLGALLAPWLFWLVQWLAAHFELFAGWTRHPFKRIFNRSLMIVALVGLWPLLRWIGYRSWSEVGYPCRRAWWRDLLTGFALGQASLTVAVFATQRTVDWNGVTLPLMGKLIATAAAVGLIEETFFRGGLQGGLQRGMHWLTALAIASAIYAALHFLKPGGVKIAPEEVTWISGFTCLGKIFSKSLSRPEVVTAFVTLYLVGWILGWAFVKTGALYLAIGLHAGWVLPNELVRELGGGAVIEDWRAWPVLLAVFGIVAWRCRRPPS